jgi:hypothetical protein
MVSKQSDFFIFEDKFIKTFGTHFLLLAIRSQKTVKDYELTSLLKSKAVQIAMKNVNVWL